MSTTVVDQLIVTLGLDPTQFKKGQKEAAKALLNAKDDTKKAGSEMGRALDEAAIKATKFFLSFEAATKIAGWLGQLTDAAANMSLLSRRTGESVHELDVFSRAVKISGGSAEEALGLVNSLTQEMTAAQAGGALSPFLQTAQAIGVAWRDANGQLRPAIDVIKDVGRAAAQNGPQIGAMLLGRAGVSGGVGDFLLRQRSEQEAILKQAQEQSVLDDKKAKDADELRKTWNSIKDAIDAIGFKLATTIGPILADAAKSTIDMLNRLANDATALTALHEIQVAFRAIYDVIKLIIDGWTQLVNLVSGTKFGGAFGKFVDRKLGMFNAGAELLRRYAEHGNLDPDAPAASGATGTPNDPRTRGLRNNNPGNLRLPGGQHDKDGFSVFPDLATGEREAAKQIQRYAARGIQSVEGIVSTYAPRKDHNDTESYINTVAKKLGVDRSATLSPDMMAQLLAAMFRVESGPGAPGVAQISSVLGAQRFGQVGPTPTGTVSTGGKSAATNVTEIGSITVYTQATDANAIAHSLRGAIVRKNLAAQADGGQS